MCRYMKSDCRGCYSFPVEHYYPVLQIDEENPATHELEVTAICGHIFCAVWARMTHFWVRLTALATGSA